MLFPSFFHLIELNLYLDKNKIKFLSGKLFEHLNKLSDVRLRNNICIDRNFMKKSEIPAMLELLNTKCAFVENDELSEITDKPAVQDVASYIESQSAFTEKPKNEVTAVTNLGIALENENLKSNITQHLLKIASLDTKLKAANELVAHQNDETENLQKNFHLKSLEISELLDEDQRKSALINEKNQKIKELMRTIDALSNQNMPN